jgi:DNA-binding response OmpR family regulator/cellulose synthase/poly-beta-1,6-N-acetylglucosamine synthase-like glycosyltransferase
MQSQSKAIILLVDDDYNFRELASYTIRSLGYEVVSAKDGAEALLRVDEIAPDLIVSDVMMPQLNGFDLLKALRANPETESIPIILLTAKGEETDIIEGLGLGADDYVPKTASVAQMQARVKAMIERPPVPRAQLPHNLRTGLLNPNAFAREVEMEVNRSEKGCLAVMTLDELEQMSARFGRRVDAAAIKQVIALITFDQWQIEVIGQDADNKILLLMPEKSVLEARRRLRRLARQVATHVFVVGDEQFRLTPVIGFVPLEKSLTGAELIEQASAAHTYAARQLDLEPLEYDPHMDALAHEVKRKTQALKKITLWTRLRKNSRGIFQIALTLFIGIVLPFILYAILGANGHDITQEVYILVVTGLLLTAGLIWWEGLRSLKRIDPPDAADYPPASAIIAAYLPNEAATIEATIEAFLRVDYPGEYQVILAYNTPRDMPIEKTFQEIARRDPVFIPMRVKDSTSKAQNVNAALARVEGKFVGVFDADHHPDPDSFKRAWRWLASGYDIVQGHCLVRNGDASWVARTVAVEFEAIYAVAHPGRARLHDFGIFGGSNGFWKTDLLRQTRMHGFMLTEDIDSSFRVIENGCKIASDPYLVSRELAPTQLQALWNQRIRWAQGWFQVAIHRSLPLFRSPKLTLRQKIGVFHLLLWREIYPWLSLQMIPIVAYWAWQAGGLHRIDWFVPIFVITTLVTLGTGPGQLLFIYRLADAQIKRNRRWFWWYLLLCIVFYTEFKNIIGRVAQIKEIMGERVWRTTSRT